MSSEHSARAKSTVGRLTTLRYVLANDISASACEAMRQNVELNGVGEKNGAGINGTGPHVTDGGSAGAAESAADEEAEMGRLGRREGCKGRVKVTEGDAW